MKLSTETTVGAAVALAFAVLSMAVIAGEQGDRGTATNNSVLSHMTARGLNSSLSAPLDGTSEGQLLAQY